MSPTELLKTADPRSSLPLGHKGDIHDAPEFPANWSTCDLYGLLLETPRSPAVRQASSQFLREQLEQASRIPHDVPANPRDLETWMERRTREVGDRYAAYLDRRRQGGPREYFTHKSHALFFLQRVAPTKLVDGAWLYGILPYWNDLRLQGLVRTYLEELGDGDPDQNHTVIYQRLLAANGCDMPAPLDDACHLRGAVQLALAAHTDQFLPEVIGYNLGYEQLPLHLLITAFELAELDIDPWYFTLHVTVDNAGSGHARRAVQAALACMPSSADQGGRAAYWRRLVNGYQLSELGPGTQDVLQAFDLEEEIVRVLEYKRVFGQHLHSDYACIGARTVNEWLSAPGNMRGFLRTLVERNWIKRNEDPSQSRFWRLIDGPHAPMAGVFTGYEKQLFHDWITGDAAAPHPGDRRRRTFSPYRAPTGKTSGGESSPPTPSPSSMSSGTPHDLDDVHLLRRELLGLDPAQRMRRLIRHMSPSLHTTPAGLQATRLFVETMDRRG